MAPPPGSATAAVPWAHSIQPKLQWYIHNLIWQPNVESKIKFDLPVKRQIYGFWQMDLFKQGYWTDMKRFQSSGESRPHLRIKKSLRVILDVEC